MSYEVKSEKFNGPLDLLLQLIEKEDLNITEISLAQVTEQYIEHLNQLTELEPDDLADFLVVAGRLLLLKSRALLPYLETEVEEESLESQLKLYKDFLEASKKIEAMLKAEHFSFARTRPPAKTEIEFSPPPNANLETLKNSFLVVLKRLDPLVKLPKQMMEKTISLQQKILELKDFISAKKNVNFQHLISNAQNRTEIIINFLAILELLKQRHLKVKQQGTFNDIIIEKI